MFKKLEPDKTFKPASIVSPSSSKPASSTEPNLRSSCSSNENLPFNMQKYTFAVHGEATTSIYPLERSKTPSSIVRMCSTTLASIIMQ